MICPTSLLQPQHPREQGRRCTSATARSIACRSGRRRSAGRWSGASTVTTTRSAVVRARRSSASITATADQLGWRRLSRNIKFRNSRAAPRVTDERRHEQGLGLGIGFGSEALSAQPSTWSRRVLAGASRESGRPCLPGASTTKFRRRFEAEHRSSAATFLKLMARPARADGVTACTKQPAGEDRPVREAARGADTGEQPLFYASRWRRRRRTGWSSRATRTPTKIEGNRCKRAASEHRRSSRRRRFEASTTRS